MAAVSPTSQKRRGWFVMSAREAILKGAQGYSPWTIAEVVGHAKGEVGLEMTMSRYAGDETLEAKAACVRAVKLPTMLALQPAAGGGAQ